MLEEPVEESEGLVEQAIDSGMKAITGRLHAGRARARRVVIMLQAEGAMVGTEDCMMVVQGFEDPEDVLTTVAVNAQQYARSMGLGGQPPAPTGTPG